MFFGLFFGKGGLWISKVLGWVVVFVEGIGDE